MPPVYDYKDEMSGRDISVVRGFSESEQLPTAEEAEKAGFSQAEFEQAKWVRIIGAPTIVRGRGWGSKGNLF
jgi:hypothetical protein